MMRLHRAVVGVDDLDRAAAFWCGVLGYREAQRRPRHVTLAPGAGGGPPLLLTRSSAEPERYPRIHLDFAVDDAAAQEAVTRRVCELGGSRVDWPHYPDDADFVVLADSEGNRFCVVDASRRS